MSAFAHAIYGVNLSRLGEAPFLADLATDLQAFDAGEEPAPWRADDGRLTQRYWFAVMQLNNGPLGKPIDPTRDITGQMEGVESRFLTLVYADELKAHLEQGGVDWPSTASLHLVDPDEDVVGENGSDISAGDVLLGFGLASIEGVQAAAQCSYNSGPGKSLTRFVEKAAVMLWVEHAI